MLIRSSLDQEMPGGGGVYPLIAWSSEFWSFARALVTRLVAVVA